VTTVSTLLLSRGMDSAEAIMKVTGDAACFALRFAIVSNCGSGSRARISLTPALYGR
jgi:hypothetical protein